MKRWALLPLEAVECKASRSDDEGEATMTIVGLGAAFGNVDSYGDVIQQGAFADFLGKHSADKPGWPAMLSQHGGWGVNADDLMPIGKWDTMEETSRGLKVSGRFARTQRGMEAYELAKMRAIDGLSIGFRTLKDAPPDASSPKGAMRVLTQIELYEISLVTWPANGKARVQAVKAADQTLREIERRLQRDAGFSRAEAEALARGGHAALAALRDAGDERSEAEDVLAMFRRSVAVAELRDGYLNRIKG